VALLLARLMDQYCLAGWRLLSSFIVIVCNAAGGWAGRPPGVWERGVGTLLDPKYQQSQGLTKIKLCKN